MRREIKLFDQNKTEQLIKLAKKIKSSVSIK